MFGFHIGLSGMDLTEKDTAIEVEDLTFSYNNHDPVLKGLSFSVKTGEKVGLVGPNGCGKTTLFLCLMGFLRPLSGHIRIFGREMIKEGDFKWARRRVGLLFQDPDDQLFCPTVLEDVAFGPLNLGFKPKDAIQIAKDTLKALKLEGFENRVTYKLSGGEKKLISLATVLSMQPKVLLLDEPTNGLDEETYFRIIEIFNNLDLTCVFISHDMDFLANTTQKIFMMKNGKILSEDAKIPHYHMHAHELGRVHHVHRRLMINDGKE